MERQKIDTFIMTNNKFFPEEKIMLLRQHLENLSDEQLTMVASVSYKDPTTALLLSLFLGGLGVDRFMIGDVGIGILKLLTFGCFGILTLIDWFTIQKKTREKNFSKLLSVSAVLPTSVAQ